jgi:hypothetical protein
MQADRHWKWMGLAAAALVIAASSCSASAAPYRWDFLGGPAGVDAPGYSGRSFVSATGGQRLVATGWGSSANAATRGTEVLGGAFLGWYDNGLGVFSGSDDGQHGVDNTVRIDFVAFDLGATLSLSRIELASYGNAGIDVWLGTLAPAHRFDTTATVLNGLDGLNYVGRRTCDAACPAGTLVSYDYDTALTGNWLVIAARGDSQGDAFKIRALEARVPLSGTTLLLGAGLIGLAALSRARRSA